MYLLHFLVGTFLFTGGALFHFFNPTPHDILCQPYGVTYTDADYRVKVSFRPKNFPTKHLDSEIVTYCRGEDGKRIKKYEIKKSGDPNAVMDFDQVVGSGWDNCYFGYCVYNQKNINCDVNKDDLLDIINLKYSKAEIHSDCTVGQCVITLDMAKHCRTRTDRPTLKIKSSVQITTGTPSILIECSAAADRLHLLSLYQDKNQESGILLKRIQHINSPGRVILTLFKTLLESDKDSKIYCVKHLPDKESGKRTSDHEKLHGPTYTFLPSDGPANVVVELDTETVWFSRDKPLSVVCRGTKPLDDRSLTWYIQDKKTSKIEVPDFNSQHYNRKKNENKLKIILNDSCDSKILFCAQDRYIQIEYENGTHAIERYDERAISKNITLKLNHEEIEDDAEAETGKKTSQGLIWGVVLSVAALLSISAFVVWKRRKGAVAETAENNYATAAELTYAVLDLPESRVTTGNPNTSPYAEIVGVYNPNKKN
ncbi:uncharacterized protein LOC133533104 isoform X1 [Cydia pomonella]|uniref:uncharacterized protein LOC133533104 isoform X1 n=1 Tax=Cydia pomonella TaxID=82600 RepID=UPI002ADE5C5A|nr:uncharacterized protein LOC133533104 isoform X1 [Cydia pomonella]